MIPFLDFKEYVSKRQEFSQDEYNSEEFKANEAKINEFLYSLSPEDASFYNNLCKQEYSNNVNFIKSDIPTHLKEKICNEMDMLTTCSKMIDATAELRNDSGMDKSR